MAELHPGASLTPTKLELVQDWITTQRWYAGKGSQARLRLVGRWRLDDPAGEVGCEVLLVADDSGAEPVVYQVPLTYRSAPLEGVRELAFVGTMEHSVLGTRWVYDGCHDPVFATQLLALAQRRVSATSSSAQDTVEPDVVGHRHPSWPTRLDVISCRVLGGEQSNTSIVYTCRTKDWEAPWIGQETVVAKVFRALSPGHNPEIEIQDALAHLGTQLVKRSVGHVTGRWRPEASTPRPEESGAPQVEGDLVYVSEFLPVAQDAWEVALEAARGQRSFAARAAELGRATGAVHRELYEWMPTMYSTAAVEAALAGMRARLAAACEAVPEVAAHAAAIEARFAAVADPVPWPQFQRIHGDYHLGQVLDVPGRGWVLIDFEGEPLRPLAERVLPDQPLRDVAGMLRSFDYVGATLEQEGVDGWGWVRQAQDGFLDGYAAETRDDPRDHADLLTAYLLDKALYEVVYEARNRPTWLPIPLRAITRLITEVPS